MIETQDNRPISVKGPLPDDVLLFSRMTGTEQLGRLWEFNLELLSLDHEISLEDMLGQSMTVRLNLADGERRYFNGIVSRFSYLGTSGEYSLYQATLKPWLWFLTRSSDCRIFQDKSVLAIIEKVFEDHGFSEYEFLLSESYRNFEYCVQYRETAFNFISRLLEQEGIYYYFKHEDGNHKLVLVDGIVGHELIPGYEQVPYFPPTETSHRRERDHISEWKTAQNLQPGAFSYRDYDFTDPRKNLEAKTRSLYSHQFSEFEYYDYPGEYGTLSDGESYVTGYREEFETQYERAQGGGDVRGLYAGGLFELTNYPRESWNREHLVISVSHQLRSDEYSSNNMSNGDSTYRCSFTAVDSQTRYRSMRMTPKPMVQGPQTAIVVGKSGQDIWTDEYGRVKVQFHWDRQGAKDENSSCWMRVAQLWAGNSWGGIHTPRIGQEVIVEFLEGDPDRPIVTGRVYNGDNMPPYKLPDNATQSGVKSRSSLGGTSDNFNEFRFEDKKGEEQIFLHAEKNHEIVVENDETREVGQDQKHKIERHRNHDISKNDTLTVGANRKIRVTGKFDERIDSGEKRKVSKGIHETITGGETRNITGDQSETVTGNVTQTITGTFTQKVSGVVRIDTPLACEVNATAGIRLVAPAGVEVVAPGGHTQVESICKCQGAESQYLYAKSLSATGLVQAAFAFRLATRGIDVRTTNVKYDTVGVLFGGKGIDYSRDKVQIKNTVTAILSAGIYIVK